MKNPFSIVNLIDIKVFPNNNCRYSKIEEFKTETNSYHVKLSRDFIGENSLHYYLQTERNTLIVANNIWDIKFYLETHSYFFVWDRVRSVHNHSEVIIRKKSFQTMKVEERFKTTLQEMAKIIPSSENTLVYASSKVGILLEQSVKERLATIPKNETIGILLSGGLDSMTIAYLLSRTKRNLVAFTLKTSDKSHDVVRAREIAKEFKIPLKEILVNTNTQKNQIIEISINNKIIYRTKKSIAINETLLISGNPKKDNVLCALSMMLIGFAIKKEGIKTVFTGEGPNEMVNDYGFNPMDYGFNTSNKGNASFRETLTFGLKLDPQLGRGGLAKHALSRMTKMFAYHKIRLESPYFTRNIVKLMTNIPYGNLNYENVKQHIVANMFDDPNLTKFIFGTVKEKFQDGAGISEMFSNYSQKDLIDIFEKNYGVRKTGYLK